MKCRKPGMPRFETEYCVSPCVMASVSFFNSPSFASRYNIPSKYGKYADETRTYIRHSFAPPSHSFKIRVATDTNEADLRRAICGNSDG